MLFAGGVLAVIGSEHIGYEGAGPLAVVFAAFIGYFGNLLFDLFTHKKNVVVCYLLWTVDKIGYDFYGVQLVEHNVFVEINIFCKSLSMGEYEYFQHTDPRRNI